MTEPIPHGGDLTAARARFPGQTDWLDLSTGINPWPYPLPRLDAAAWTRLPDAGRVEAAERAADAFYGAPPGSALAVPGTQAALQLLPTLRPAGRVAIVGFTYQEHARCWRRAGHAVAETPSLAEAVAAADVVVAVNPNNPDGAGLDPSDLLRARDALASRGGWLVVDEAFGETRPEVSVAGACGAPGLIVLRSFGKFFGLAGVRLGFVLTDAETQLGLRDALGPWAVSGPALELGRIALADSPWAVETRLRLTAAADRLGGLLSAAGLRVVGGTPLFALAATEDAARLHEHLMRHGIMVRRFDERPHWLRFGLPPDERAEARLRRCLAAYR